MMGDNLFDSSQPTILIVEDTGAARSAMFDKISLMKTVGKISCGNIFAPTSYTELEETLQVIAQNNQKKVILITDHQLEGFGCNDCDGKTICEYVCSTLDQAFIYRVGVSNKRELQLNTDGITYVHTYLGKEFTTKGLIPAMQEADLYFESKLQSESNELNKPQ